MKVLAVCAFGMRSIESIKLAICDEVVQDRPLRERKTGRCIAGQDAGIQRLSVIQGLEFGGINHDGDWELEMLIASRSLPGLFVLHVVDPGFYLRAVVLVDDCRADPKRFYQGQRRAVALAAPMPAAPVRPRGNASAGSLMRQEIVEKTLTADLDTRVVVVCDVPIRIALSVPGPAAALLRIQGFDYPFGDIPIPFIGDVLRPEGDKTRSIDDDV